MRLTLSSAVLSSRLLTLSKVLNSKNSLQILDCILFDVKDGVLTLTASDNENEIRSSIQLDESDGNGRFAILSRTILDAMKELPEQPVTFDIDTNSLAIKVIYQNGDYNFTIQNADEFPQTESVQENAATIKIQSGVLADNITRTIFATANEEIRPVMNGIYFDITPESLAIVASDGHKLVRNKILNISSENPTSFILPKKPSNLLKNILAHDDSEVTISFDNRNAVIESSFGTLTCRLIEGRYPNYASVIPADNPCRLTVDRKTLIGSLRRVLPFASESSQLIRLRISLGQLEVSSEDIDFSTSAKEDITCDYSSTPMSIGFKGSSLMEILTNLGSDDVILELADPSRPCIILPSEQPENQDVLMLIMPMLLND